MRDVTLFVLCQRHPGGCGLVLDKQRQWARAWVRKEDAVEWAKSNVPGAEVRPMKAALPLAGTVAPERGTA